MFSKEIKDLQTLKQRLIDDAALGSSSTGHPQKYKNTPQFQVILDLLTNYPTATNVTMGEVYRMHNNSLFLQSFAPDSKFTLIALSKPMLPIYSNKGYNTIFNLTLGHEDNIEKLFKSTYVGNIIEQDTPSEVDEIYKSLCAKNVNKTPMPYDTLDMINKGCDGGNERFTSLYFDPVEIPFTLDYKNYHAFHYFTSNRTNYVIQKSPFIVKYQENGRSFSNWNYNISIDDEVICFKDKIVIITSGGLNARADFKVLSLPDLKLLESGSNVKLEIYKQLKLVRTQVTGPNAYNPNLDEISTNVIKKKVCRVVGGFRINPRGYIQDVYAGNLKKAEGYKNYYKRVMNEEENTWYVLYY